MWVCSLKFSWLRQPANLPQYLGPSAFQLVHLFLLIVANSIVLFALVILLFRTVWCLAINNTTIEVWEIERHEALLRRARYLGGSLDGPDGAKVHIVRQEFPYDIGIWRNFRQGMGTGNVCFSLQHCRHYAYVLVRSLRGVGPLRLLLRTRVGCTMRPMDSKVSCPHVRAFAHKV